jgi:hypothetical protein
MFTHVPIPNQERRKKNVRRVGTRNFQSPWMMYDLLELYCMCALWLHCNTTTSRFVRPSSLRFVVRFSISRLPPVSLRGRTDGREPPPGGGVQGLAAAPSPAVRITSRPAEAELDIFARDRGPPCDMSTKENKRGNTHTRHQRIAVSRVFQSLIFLHAYRLVFFLSFPPFLKQPAGEGRLGSLWTCHELVYVYSYVVNALDLVEQSAVSGVCVWAVYLFSMSHHRLVFANASGTRSFRYMHTCTLCWTLADFLNFLKSSWTSFWKVSRSIYMYYTYMFKSVNFFFKKNVQICLSTLNCRCGIMKLISPRQTLGKWAKYESSLKATPVGPLYGPLLQNLEVWWKTQLQRNL